MNLKLTSSPMRYLLASIGIFVAVPEPMPAVFCSRHVKLRLNPEASTLITSAVVPASPLDFFMKFC